MSKSRLMIHLASLGVALLIASAALAEGAKPAKGADQDKAVQALLDEYVAAFNKHDAEEVVKCWSESGEFVDEATGERIAGRDAIRDDLARLFEGSKELLLAATLDTVRAIRPDVVQITGTAVTSLPDEEPRESKFTAIAVRQEKRWVFDSIEESVIAPGPQPYEQLQSLEPLIGQWVDDSDEVRVDTTVRWGANRSFLVRAFTIEQEGVTRQGTQIIGWDPRREVIRCWMFESDGSFGEGTWSTNDDGWTVKFSQTLADGRAAGCTQVITRIDEDTLTVQSVGREIDGEMQPAGEPVRVVRVRADAE